MCITYISLIERHSKMSTTGECSLSYSNLSTVWKLFKLKTGGGGGGTKWFPERVCRCAEAWGVMCDCAVWGLAHSRHSANRGGLGQGGRLTKLAGQCVTSRQVESLTRSRRHASIHSVCFHRTPTVQGPGPVLRTASSGPRFGREGQTGKETTATQGGGTLARPLGPSRLLPGPRRHMQGRCMTEGCPGGSRGQVGTGFMGQGRMASRERPRATGRHMGYLGGGAGLAQGLCHLSPPPGACQAG